MNRDDTIRKLRAKLDELGRWQRGRVPTRPRPAPKPSAVPAEPEATAPVPILYRRDLPRTRRSAGAVSPVRTRVVRLAEVVKGEEVSYGEGRSALLIRTRVGRLRGGEEIGPAYREAMRSRRSGLRRRLATLAGPPAPAITKTIFVDVESTGLGNTPLFLIGVMVWERGGFEVKQFFARSYAEEAAVIAAFDTCCRNRTLLVTFNGKSFDIPFIRTRAVANGLPFDHDLPHFDLLHECRRIWRGSLPNCKLQTLETHVCGRTRSGDIPGARIPDAYHEFVRSDNAVEIVEILKHNMLDLVTLADLMARLPRPEPG